MNSLPNGSNPKTSSFTCNTCNVRFINADLQRQHMKTDWHRYNLKRRVAQLPSIASDVFAEKVLRQDIKFDESKENEDEDGFYVAMRKVKHNSKKKHHHLSRSQQEMRGRFMTRSPVKMEQKERSLSPTLSVASQFSQFSLTDGSEHGGHDLEPIHTGSDLYYTDSRELTDLDAEFLELDSDEEKNPDLSGQEEIEEEEEEENAQLMSLTSCFYCGVENQEIEDNIKHMFKRHGLYIPERTYLVDVEGLLAYLRDAAANDECLVCGYQARNTEGLRQHIYVKGHCKIPYESKEEKLTVAQFYDFSIGETTKPRKKSSKSVGFADDAVSSGQANADEGMDEDEDHDQDESEGSGINDNYTLVQIDPTGVELTTPSGSRIGHRSMQHYYRQNIALPVVLSNEDGRKTQALVDRRFAPGVTSREISRGEKEAQKIENRAKSHEVRRMKPRKINYQRHFRDEILGT